MPNSKVIGVPASLPYLMTNRHKSWSKPWKHSKPPQTVINTDPETKPYFAKSLKGVYTQRRSPLMLAGVFRIDSGRFRPADGHF